MFRTPLIAVALMGIAAPALADAPVSATPGALAGRSPHASYVAADAGQAGCGKVMHSLPAGKPHTYGLNAIAARPCDTAELASAKVSSPVAGN